MQKFSYHTHTVFSDGENSIDEMLEQAVKCGYEQIGVSDHLIINEFIVDNKVPHKNPKYAQQKMYINSFGEKTTKLLQSHISKIRETANKYPIEVLVGFEVDFFSYDGWLDKFSSLIDEIDIDYLIIGNHFCMDEKGKIVAGAESLSSFIPDENEQKKYIKIYFENYMNSIKSGLFDFCAHLTYIGRSGVCNVEDYYAEYVKILKAVKESGMAIELNTRKDIVVRKFMPSMPILEAARDIDIPILISDDCHDKNKMMIGFKEAEDLLSELNYTNRWKIEY